MPGPVAFMTSIYMGRVRANFIGAILAAIGIVLPSAIIMILFSIFFSSISKFQFTEIFLTGMQICALGVILGSLKGLVKNNFKSMTFWQLVVAAAIINYYHPNLEPFIILLFGIMFVLIKKQYPNAFFDGATLILLGLVCFKAGALVFGTGLAIVPMLKHDVVNKYHWLSQNEFLDALAFGQMTPGPVVITSTYIGHKVAGLSGAIIATLGIFSASFFHMNTWFPIVIKKLSGQIWINHFVFGAVAAVVGPIIVTVFKLYLGLPVNYLTAIFFFSIFGLTLHGKTPFWALIPFGGLFYFIFSHFLFG
jgi:chromate transporter